MRLKDNNNPFIYVNPPYQLMVIHSSQLVYPRELYQRGVERKRVELIAAHFNEYVANEPKVSFRNGQFIVTDGQHTIEGRILRNGGKDLPILCKVYTGMTVEQEALLFAQQTGESARLTPGDKMRAMIYGGDPECMAFLKATEAVGLKLDYSQRRGKYRLGCIGTAFEEFKRVGADLYKEALSMIVAAWQLSRPHPVDETGRRSWRSAPVFASGCHPAPQKTAKRKRNGDPESLRSETVQGVIRFIELYHGEYDPRRLISRLHKTDPLTIYREGRAMGVNMAGYKKYLYQVYCIYNGSSKKKVLPMKF